MKTPSSPIPQRVLLVDDNRDGLLVRRSLLEELGCIVEVAHNGEEGFALFQASNFDVVVTDYRMPRMHGIELIGRIRQINPNARIVLFSGVAGLLGLTEESTGADTVIAKGPNEAGQLTRAVKRLLNTGKRKPPSSQGGGPKRFRATAR